MAHYRLHPSPDTFNSRRFLLGPPLVLVAAFCFGLVMIQSHTHSTQRASISASRPVSKTNSASSPSNLSTHLAPVSTPPAASNLSTADNPPSATAAGQASPGLDTAVSQSKTASPTGVTANPQQPKPAAKNQTPLPLPAKKDNPGKSNPLKATAHGLKDALDGVL